VGIRTTDLYGLYATGTGTSLAAPHVAGALALLLSAFPDLSADRQQAALEGGAVDLGAAGLDSDFGYGRLDVAAAYRRLSSTPDFTVAVSPASVSTPAGGNASYTVWVAGVNGFAGDVALSLTGLPASVGTATFSPAVIAPAGNSQLTIATATTAPPGSYPLTVTGSSGSTTRTSLITLVVNPRDVTLSVSPTSITVSRGQTASYTVTVSAVGGFTGTVSLSATGLPARATATFSANPVGVPGTSVLRIRTTSLTARGTFTVQITGTSGSLLHQVTVTLTVR
jgi:hypothetical protein